jgi:hypothetical protein
MSKLNEVMDFKGLSQNSYKTVLLNLEKLDSLWLMPNLICSYR